MPNTKSANTVLARYPLLNKIAKLCQGFKLTLCSATMPPLMKVLSASTIKKSSLRSASKAAG